MSESLISNNRRQIVNWPQLEIDILFILAFFYILVNKRRFNYLGSNREIKLDYVIMNFFMEDYPLLDSRRIVRSLGWFALLDLKGSSHFLYLYSLCFQSLCYFLLLTDVWWLCLCTLFDCLYFLFNSHWLFIFFFDLGLGSLGHLLLMLGK